MTAIQPNPISARSRPTTIRSDDPQLWRDRAEEARALAEQFDDLQAMKAMLRVAEEYDALAQRAEWRRQVL